MIVQAHPGFFIVRLEMDRDSLGFEPIIAWEIDEDSNEEEPVPIGLTGRPSGTSAWVIKRPDGRYAIPDWNYETPAAGIKRHLESVQDELDEELKKEREALQGDSNANT